MGTKTRRKRKTRREKVEESRGKTPQRLKDQLNRMTVKTDNKEVK
jgi:hypothetical protein